MTRLPLLLSLISLAFGLVARAPSSRAATPGSVDFGREIRPILSDKCFACHGPDDAQRKGGLRLDHRDSALGPAKSGAHAIVPGKPSESELLSRILTADEDDRMPPAKTGKTLSTREVDLLQRWIAGGAEYREHWSFVTPTRPTPPGNPPPSGAIDAFVREKLAKESLPVSPEADRSTLARRVTLDLTGLPPTPEELDSFLADRSPKAYEALVDRLLESPRYGERMAVEWLDAARYADTHGYHLDSGRDLTAWRDWVIRSFNENKPFDAFTVEQLAGDLLPDATLDQKIASGFHRNHMINYEGGAIAEEYQYAYLVDRVNTTSTVWLGLSMTCAQCHDHKYDPLSMTDFYRLLAFFNNVPERGLDGNRGNAAPVLRLPSPEQAARLSELDATARSAEAALASPGPALEKAQATWEAEVLRESPVQWTALDITPAPSAQENNPSSQDRSFVLLDDRSLRVTGANPERDTYILRFDNPLSALTAIRLEALVDPALPRSGPGRAPNGNFVLSSVRVAAGENSIPLASASADFSQKGYAVEGILDADPASGWAIDGGQGEAHAAVLQFAAPQPPGTLTLKLSFESGIGQHGIGRLRLSGTPAANPHGTVRLPAEVRNALVKAPAARSETELAAIRKHYREKVSAEYRALRAAATTARKARDDFEATLPTTMVMAELEKPRDTFMRIRGQYDKLGGQVTAGTPAALPPMRAGEPVNRLGLARWLVSKDHPLTARVIVNRFWQMYFGIGIVRTAEDFGSQGEWPTHPELLDWLAREFVDSGWNVKHLQRLIVTSATYRQTARASQELHARDPENRLLARGPRFRLQAEFIRDQALAISGLLDPRIGGHSVSPYQPAGLWSELSMREDSKNFSAQVFVQSTGADLYRRSMYTFWKRSSPPPQLSTFDAPNRETCTVRRPRTNTPLQALVLLNDPTYIEASRKLAERLLERTDTDAERVSWAFRLATARVPTDREKAVLLRVLEEQRTHYRTHRDAAEQLLSHGDAPRDLTRDTAELAAWTMLSSTILNLDETVTKG